MKRNNPPVVTSKVIAIMDAPRTPLQEDEEKIDQDRIALVGTTPRGINIVVPCTPTCMRKFLGYEGEVQVNAPVHKRTERLRYLVCIGADKKAFRLDSFVDLEVSKMDRSNAPATVNVRVSQDNEGTLDIVDVPNNLRAESLPALLLALSKADTIDHGNVFGGYTVIGFDGDIVKLRPAAGTVNTPGML